MVAAADRHNHGELWGRFRNRPPNGKTVCALLPAIALKIAKKENAKKENAKKENAKKENQIAKKKKAKKENPFPATRHLTGFFFRATGLALGIIPACPVTTPTRRCAPPPFFPLAGSPT